ncbi:MAG: alpha/beta hydrolase fold domain-containing protein [Flavobacteriales bacterium]|nr:alpha/beta hydrolase fold domain-containing protein [Flavobacteriales bacterium]MCW8938176.1 alpha/beta hydrolase fold domain-containing protein [Flavobacteriales bacterium]MCW8941354.1 alpha/beta hydrolase fold domain-containing protein [Flavobacteriales bacterium]MCW8967032.1 alpha/beta hydrolase fold domain-containing protein [Flavobacteriales bacterium]MCW9018917.1 alpha/beta hydrolase fold domain-containing protein [Flavobacteriales bacterium]
MIIKNKILTNNIIEKPIVLDVGFKPTKKPKPIVIFAHGFKGFKDWGHFNEVMDFFITNECVFLKFNFSHNGGTVEQSIDFPDLEIFGKNTITKELNDVLYVLDWIYKTEELPKEELDINDITLIGHSRGGGIAMLAASMDKRIKKIITWAAISDFESRLPPNLSEWESKGVVYIENMRTKQQMPMYYSFVEDLLNNRVSYKIENAIKKTNQPHLIIHGDNDLTVNVEEAKQLNEWNKNADLKIITGANHTFDISHPHKEEQLSEAAKKVLTYSLAFIKKMV